MSAACYASRHNMQSTAPAERTMRLPAPMCSASAMAAMAAATCAASLLLSLIGALTPISLFVQLLIASITLLSASGLLFLIGLALTRLVSLTSLSLVTLTTGLTPGTPRGE
jgi:hypothetical protein